MSETAPPNDITPDQWDIIQDILNAHVANFDVWAFGSRATRTAKPYSDLDLVIMTQLPLPLTVSAAMAEAFSESDLPWKVDIVDWATTSESFRQIITRDRVAVRRVAERATLSPS